MHPGRRKVLKSDEAQWKARQARRARTYNEDLGALPQGGSRVKPLVRGQGANSPEDESLLDIGGPKEKQYLHTDYIHNVPSVKNSFSEHEFTFTFAICCRSSVCRLSVTFVHST